MPSMRRNVSALALRMTSHGGRVWLFDCGEATQHQILKTPVKLSKLDKLFVTHLHGDHIFGLPGLLGSRAFQGGEAPLTLYGPNGLRQFVQTALAVAETQLPYPLHFVEVADGMTFAADPFTVEVARLEHRIDSFGYRLCEHPAPGKLQAARLRADGVPPGPLYRRLKRGETVVLPDGRTIDGRDYVASPVPGRQLAILGDTRYCEAAVQLARNADVLVHEATFARAEAALAAKYYHATALDAARVACDADVGTLILTHISARYEGAANELLAEAEQVFPNTYIAHDLWSYELPK